MPLGVNQNLAANGVLIQLKNNDKLYNRQIERLSSGLRINTAADDPAGLVISEKYKLQTEGLGQAIKNAQDGISLAQTAEGALQEITTQLRSMRNLALHAANTGPNDTAAIQADQDQIAKAIETLNRIATSTQFGTRKLLDGSSGATGLATDANVTFIGGTPATVGGSYDVNITQAAVQGKMQSQNGLTVDTLTGGNAMAGAATTGDLLTFSGALVGTTPYVMTLTAGEDKTALVKQINADSTLQTAGITASEDGTGHLVLTGTALSTTGGIGINGTASALSLAGVSGTETEVTTAATDAAKISNAETLTFSNGSGNSVQVSLAKGTTLKSALSQVQTALDDAGIMIKAAWDATNSKMTFTNTDYGSGTTVKNTISSSLAGGGTNLDITIAAGTAYTVSNSGIVGNTDGADVMGTLGGLNATGVGQLLTGDAGDAKGLSIKVAGGAVGALGTVTVNQNSMEFQIGAYANQTVSLGIGDVRAAQLGTTATVTSMTSVSVSAIDVTKVGGAQDAIRILDAASTQITTLRATLGSFQKDTMESSVRNMMVAQQNIQTSQSQITDANMAEETLTYSRAQILQQTGIAMLTQANQAPQQLLSLFK